MPSSSCPPSGLVLNHGIGRDITELGIDLLSTLYQDTPPEQRCCVHLGGDVHLSSLQVPRCAALPCMLPHRVATSRSKTDLPQHKPA